MQLGQQNGRGPSSRLWRLRWRRRKQIGWVGWQRGWRNCRVSCMHTSCAARDCKARRAEVMATTMKRKRTNSREQLVYVETSCSSRVGHTAHSGSRLGQFSLAPPGICHRCLPSRPACHRLCRNTWSRQPQRVRVNRGEEVDAQTPPTPCSCRSVTTRSLHICYIRKTPY